MKYQVSVSKNNRPLFNTGAHNMNREQATALLTLFYTKFPRSEGYECTCWDETRPLDESELLDLDIRKANPAGPCRLALEECAFCHQMKPRGREGSCCEDCYLENFPN